MIKRKLDQVKKILFVHQGFELYGSDKSLLRNIRVVRSKYPKAEIVVILPQNGILSEILEKEIGIKVRIMKMGVLRKYDLKHFNLSIIPRVFAFRKLISYLNLFDLIFLNSIVIVDFIIASRFCKSKCIIHVREIPTGIQKFVFCRLLSFSKADLLFVSKSTKSAFSNLSNANQTVLLNGCAQVRTLERVEKDKGIVNILLPGRINNWKGQPLLVKAISKIEPEKRKNIRVRILGDVYGKQQYLKERLLKLIHNKQLEHIFEVIPFTKNPEIHYNWADIVIVPSLLPEPFGLVAIEAMSIGKLVIAANHGGLTEIILDHYTGLFFEPCNESDLANKISYVLNNLNLIETYGKNGMEVYNQKFSNDVYSRNFLEII